MASPEPSPAPDAARPEPARLRAWPGALSRWFFGKVAKPKEPAGPPEPVARFRNICISRETGSGAGMIARMVGTRLNWKVFDHELLEAIASRMELSLDEVRVFDELAPSVVQDWILPLREEHYAPQEAYLDHLAKLVEAIGRAGDSIIIGRGAGFLLPREETLSVRIVAPLKVRAIRLAERMGVSVRTARRAARDLDRRRDHFVRTMYRFDANDPHNYDIVLDSESLGPPIIAEILVRTVEAGWVPKKTVGVEGVEP
jgi:cytidylate kinase